MAGTQELKTSEIVSRKDKRLLKLGTTWFAALVVMLFFGVQIITFNAPFYSDMLAPNTVDPTPGFTPLFISMFVLYLAFGAGYLGWKKYKYNGVVSNKEFNVFRLTGYTIMTMSISIYVLAPILYGTFITFILGPGIAIGAIPTGYSMLWPSLFIVFLVIIPIIGILMVYSKKEEYKGGGLNVDARIYAKTRNGLLSMFTVYMFLAPLIISGQGIGMLDATGFYKYNGQSNMFFGVYMLSTIGFTGIYIYSMKSKKDGHSFFKKSTKTKDIFGTTVVAMTTFSFALGGTDQFVINNIYTIGVGSLGTRVPQDLVLHYGEQYNVTVGVINNVILPLVNQLTQPDILMGVNDPYYITTFVLAIAMPVTFMMIPTYYYAVINPDTKLVTADSIDKLRDGRFNRK